MKSRAAGIHASLWLVFKNVVFTLLVPGTVAGFIPFYLLGQGTAPSAAGLVPGLIALTAGLSGYLWCLWDFSRHGKGTPAPIDAPKILVIRGLYRLLRNPMYLSVLLVIGAWAVAFQSLPVALYGALVAVLFHLFVVFYEEPHLRALFGDSYQIYCSRTRRWIPTLHTFLTRGSGSP